MIYFDESLAPGQGTINLSVYFNLDNRKLFQELIFWKLIICYSLSFLQEGEKLPVVYLYLTKSEDDFIQYTSELEYEAMVKFITDHTK